MPELFSILAELLFSTVWGLVGVVAGVIAAGAAYYLLIGSPHQVNVSAATFVVVSVVCIAFGAYREGSK